MNKAYSRRNWQNYPSTNTPLNESNLNAMDLALDTVDNRVITLDTTKLDKSTANTMVKDVTYNEANGIFTITYLNGVTATLDTKLEKLAVNFAYDAENERLVITLSDGTIQYVDLKALITQYDFTNSSTIAFTLGSNGKVTANIVDGSITEDKLQPNFLAECRTAKEGAEQAEAEATQQAENATAQALVSEGYANGTQNGTEVGPSSPYYHNNAKYWKEEARAIAGGGVTSFNGRSGSVVPQSGDYSIEMLEGADILAYGKERGGRNIWNEVWEVGNIIFSTGLPNPNANCIRSAEFCVCKPNTSYFLYCGSATNLYFVYIFFYDKNKALISGNYVANTAFVTPTNAKYFKITTQTAGTSTYGNVYRNDIAIVEGTSGSYEPYVPYSVKALGNKAENLEFLGWSVPSECPVQNYRDNEGNFHQKVGRVDLGSLTWGRYNFGSATDPVYCFSVNIADRVLGSATVYNTKYPRVNNSPATQSDKTISSTSNNTYIYIRDDSYADSTSFQNAVKDIYLYYELAEEIVIPCGLEKFTQSEDDSTNLEFLGYTIPKEMKIRNYKDVNGDFHQRVGRVNLGSLAWAHQIFNQTDNVFSITTGIQNIKSGGGSSSEEVGNIFCEYYPSVSPKNIYYKQVSVGICLNNSIIRILDNSYTDATTFKTAMSGKYLYYELATEVVIKCGNEKATEIDNKLDKSGGTVKGTLTSEGASDGVTTPLHIRSASANWSLVEYSNTSKVFGYLGMSSDSKPYMFAPDRIAKELHHDGNSAKVVISSSAPSDTSALWVVP